MGKKPEGKGGWLFLEKKDERFKKKFPFPR